MNVNEWIHGIICHCIKKVIKDLAPGQGRKGVLNKKLLDAILSGLMSYIVLENSNFWPRQTHKSWSKYYKKNEESTKFVLSFDVKYYIGRQWINNNNK